jgi:hypothetical protein
MCGADLPRLHACACCLPPLQLPFPLLPTMMSYYAAVLTGILLGMTDFGVALPLAGVSDPPLVVAAAAKENEEGWAAAIDGDGGRGAGSSDDDGPLLLTPLLRQGRVAEARKRSRVVGAGGQDLGESGFLTTDEASGNHMFYWFFPAQSGDPKAPVVVSGTSVPRLPFQLLIVSGS